MEQQEFDLLVVIDNLHFILIRKLHYLNSVFLLEY